MSAKDKTGVNECIQYITDEAIKVNLDKDYEILDKQEYNNDEIKFNIVLVGENGYGKTCICSRFGENLFKEKYITSIAVNMNKINVERDNILYNIYWYTSCREGLAKLYPNYIRKADCICFVYAINSKDSFEKISFWLGSVKEANNSRLKWF